MLLKLKVCGMREPMNIKELIGLSPDYIGFIFYEKSSRYVKKTDNLDVIHSIPSSIKRVGVFVKEPIASLREKVEAYQLDFVQLHGGESLEYCIQVKGTGVGIIKVFSVQDTLDFDEIRRFDEVADYFLFDTKTPAYGGSGKKFDWDMLRGYDMQTPYFLSGGIGMEDMSDIKVREFPGLMALDVNSKFEDSPGLKNIESLQVLKDKMTNK